MNTNDKLFEIEPVPTNKSRIKQPKHAPEKIPKIPHITMFCGKAGSGKTTVLYNLYKKHYKDFYNTIFLFRGSPDDVLKKIGDELNEKNVFTEQSTFPEKLKIIMGVQEKILENKKNKIEDNSVLIIIDDCAGLREFVRKDLETYFIKSRHYNMSFFITTQAYKMYAPNARKQANAVFFFKSNRTETEALCEDYCPANMKKKDFMRLIGDCFDEKYNFFYINEHNKNPSKHFRKNMTEIIDQTKYLS